MVTFDEFKKLDIRIGTVKEVTIVPDADKLLQLSIDIGEETPRTIVSGIREFFEDEQFLVGKQVPVITNLEPRTIRGIESQGMVMAVGSATEFVLLTPITEVPAGSEVR